MTGLQERVRTGLSRARVARYERQALLRELKFRAGQERLARQRAGIRDNMGAGNGGW